MTLTASPHLIPLDIIQCASYIRLHHANVAKTDRRLVQSDRYSQTLAGIVFQSGRCSTCFGEVAHAPHHQPRSACGVVLVHPGSGWPGRIRKASTKKNQPVKKEANATTPSRSIRTRPRPFAEDGALRLERADCIHGCAGSPVILRRLMARRSHHQFQPARQGCRGGSGVCLARSFAPTTGVIIRRRRWPICKDPVPVFGARCPDLPPVDGFSAARPRRNVPLCSLGGESRPRQRFGRGWVEVRGGVKREGRSVGDRLGRDRPASQVSAAWTSRWSTTARRLRQSAPAPPPSSQRGVASFSCARPRAVASPDREGRQARRRTAKHQFEIER
ncbi:MAG: hypothetical protein Udaeo2_21410 [Candidatus Udaeobacter sp.]|nr:MAG: hypothetical protein Udaeo2_21410 [Candidatus Udaeobacter sp.]